MYQDGQNIWSQNSDEKCDPTTKTSKPQAFLDRSYRWLWRNWKPWPKQAWYETWLWGFTEVMWKQRWVEVDVAVCCFVVVVVVVVCCYTGNLLSEFLVLDMVSTPWGAKLFRSVWMAQDMACGQPNKMANSWLRHQDIETKWGELNHSITQKEIQPCHSSYQVSPLFYLTWNVNHSFSPWASKSTISSWSNKRIRSEHLQSELSNSASWLDRWLQGKLPKKQTIFEKTDMS